MTANKEQESNKRQVQELMMEMQIQENERTAQIMRINDVMERKRRL
jgi:hypothetical protein